MANSIILLKNKRTISITINLRGTLEKVILEDFHVIFGTYGSTRLPTWLGPIQAHTRTDTELVNVGWKNAGFEASCGLLHTRNTPESL